MIDGTERWCQGFSEPGAGSDLASLTTTATRDGDNYVVNGHKIWTSYSDVADWCLLLARTDPDAKRHRGMSAFVISMKQPGVQQRPLRMINGVTTEFGQVLLRRRYGARRPDGRRARRGLAAGHDRRRARTRARRRWAMRPATASWSGSWPPRTDGPPSATNWPGPQCRPRC